MGRRLLDIVQHGFGRTDKVGHLQQRRIALGMCYNGRVGMFGFQLQDALGLHRIVHCAHAVPQHHIAAGHAIDVATQVAVGGEDDLLILGQRTHQLLGIAACADQVAQGLDLGRTVHIADHHVVGMLRLESRKFICLATLGQRARRFHVGQQHLARWVKYLGRLGHEMHSAEHNDIRRGLLSLLRQRQTVTHIVGQLLYFVPLIIMPEYDGILLTFQPEYFLFQLIVGHVIVGFEGLNVTAKVRIFSI